MTAEPFPPRESVETTVMVSGDALPFPASCRLPVFAEPLKD